MLTVGLTGGIGSGKSAVSSLLAGLGATVVDADALAREVVAPGSPGLAAVVAAFGPAVLRPDGFLDRAALAERVFSDEAARRRLDAIVHPRVGERTQALVEAAARAGVQILVHDVPLLVEAGLGPGYHLVVVVDAPVEVRLTRLAERGLTPEQARVRMAAQVDAAGRRSAADVWLDNSGTRESLRAQVAALYDDRLVPYARNLAERLPARRGPVELVAACPFWPDEAARLAARLRHLCASAQVTHVGSTAVPGLAARDVLDLLVELPADVDAGTVLDRLSGEGFPPAGGEAGSGDACAGACVLASARVHASADPGRPADVYVTTTGSAAARSLVSWRDRLRTEPAARAAYADGKRRLAERYRDDTRAYRGAKVTLLPPCPRGSGVVT